MRRVNATVYAATGAGLIAVTWGLARYAFGLFVPPIRAELGLSPDVVGVVGALPFVSFACASVVAPLVADRLGARHAAVVSGTFALAGLTLISRSVGAVTLGTGVFACGIATGLMMPALSAGVQAAVRPRLHGRVNAVMNAGTSLGLVACVPAVLLVADAWRGAYASFAAIAAIGIVAAWRLIPSVSRVDAKHAEPTPPVAAAQWRALVRLSLFAFAAGIVAAPYWIFAPDLAVEAGGLEPGLTALLWLAVGVAGLAGAWASDLGDRIGLGTSHALCLVATGGALALMAGGPGQFLVALVSAAVFGWAFMTLSGLLLVSGVRLLAEWPSAGPVVPFLAATIGQAVGSPLVGWTIGRIGYTQTFASFAVLALLVAACSSLYPSTARGPWRRVAHADGSGSP